MAKFNVGDMVQPQDGCYTRNTPGSPYNLPRTPMRITSYLDDCCMRVLVGANESPPVNPQFFDLASQHGPVRTVTRKEIVFGNYSGVEVHADNINGKPTPFVKFYAQPSAEELRAAAKVFIELADALAT